MLVYIKQQTSSCLPELPDVHFSYIVRILYLDNDWCGCYFQHLCF